MSGHPPSRDCFNFFHKNRELGYHRVACPVVNQLRMEHCTEAGKEPFVRGAGAAGRETSGSWP